MTANLQRHRMYAYGCFIYTAVGSATLLYNPRHGRLYLSRSDSAHTIASMYPATNAAVSALSRGILWRGHHFDLRVMFTTPVRYLPFNTVFY